MAFLEAFLWGAGLTLGAGATILLWAVILALIGGKHE